MRGPSVTLTRTSAALSIVALIAVALSDFLLTGFWDRNAMVTSVVADVLVVIVGVAVVNEFLAARTRREWRLLRGFRRGRVAPRPGAPVSGRAPGPMGMGPHMREAENPAG